MYKRYPKLLQHLSRILRLIWRRGKVSQQWRSTEEVWVPKDEKSTTIKQFRTISLLNVDRKIFFSILSHRLSDYLLKNQYIDTSDQNGGDPRCSRVPWTQWSGNTTDQRGPWRERRPGCTLAGPSQCVWLHTPQASGGGIGEAPCPEQHQTPHHGLL